MSSTLKANNFDSNKLNLNKLPSERLFPNRTASDKIPGELRERWHGRRYYSLDAYLKNTYGHKLHKASLDAGFTCPNRDGTLDTRGCIFCSAGGSGDFAAAVSRTDLSGQFTVPDTIAYFQAYTNTYAPIEKLEALYRAALIHPNVAGISIATRPDCLAPDVLALLDRLHREFCFPQGGQTGKFIWIELGLQTIHEKTASYIRRGYPLSVFDTAVSALKKYDIPVIVHVILGLPGETAEDMLATIHYLNTTSVFGIKLQLLHVLRGTDLYNDYMSGKFEVLSKENYINILVDCISHLDADIVLHRLTGDGPKELLEAPLWSCNKKDVLNTFHHEMKVRSLYQGIYAGEQA